MGRSGRTYAGQTSEMMPVADSLASTRFMGGAKTPGVRPSVRCGYRDLPPHPGVFSRGRFSANCR
jgi:hypothetical protein